MSRFIITQQIQILINEMNKLQHELRDVIEPALDADDSRANRRDKNRVLTRLNMIRKELSLLTEQENAELLNSRPKPPSAIMPDEPSDMSLNCQDCTKDFTFSVKDQKYHQDNGYENPKRCEPCRVAKKTARPRDLRIDCSDCDKYFWFTVIQQRSFAKNNWENPKRCTDCTAAKKARTLQPLLINCKDCQDDFTFSVGAQLHFKNAEWKNPTRCSDCRKTHRAAATAAATKTPTTTKT